jgi:hypothetical protein
VKRQLLTILLVLLALLVAGAQENMKRIALTPTSTVSSSVIAQGLEHKCVGVTLTLDTSKADYLLEAKERVSPNGRVVNGWALTVFSPGGDLLYHTSTTRSDNAVKDVCKALHLAK